MNRQHMYYQLATQCNTMRQHTLTHCGMLLIKLLPAVVKGLSRKDSRQNNEIGSISKLVTISQQKESVKQLGFHPAGSEQIHEFPTRSLAEAALLSIEPVKWPVTEPLLCAAVVQFYFMYIFLRLDGNRMIKTKPNLKAPVTGEFSFLFIFKVIISEVSYS